ncbi:TetR/AcrR family transcriptional regulator [Streptomyces lannensis]|uniref:TetR/AcrR family transcriptional regulator n=1 Tax=Streptomyces lannensis TaxID=766498 RepID=A0ABP7KWL2_9ACTN
MATSAGTSDSVRERVLAAACDLFTTRGINTTGVDLIAAAAGVSKRSLYQRYASKDDLIAAYLPVATDKFLDLVLPPAEACASPADAILEVFAASQRAAAEPGFRGCPVLNASAEICDPAHPVRAAAVAYKDQLHAYFATYAEAAGAENPALLAEQLVMLFDGAMTHTTVRGVPFPDSVHTTARMLIGAQGVRVLDRQVVAAR